MTHAVFVSFPFLALQLANAAGNPLELSLSLLPALQRGDDQMAVHLLAHDQVSSVDVVHLLTDALQAVLQPQLRLPQLALCHAVQLVNGLALVLRHDLGVTVDVGDLLHFDLQSLVQTGEKIRDLFSQKLYRDHPFEPLENAYVFLYGLVLKMHAIGEIKK